MTNHELPRVYILWLITCNGSAPQLLSAACGLVVMSWITKTGGVRGQGPPRVADFQSRVGTEMTV